MPVFAFQSTVMAALYLVLTAVKLWAFIDALLRPAQAYIAADKLTKPGWLIILGLGLAFALVLPSVIGLISIVAIVAAFVYLLDARPALREVTRRRW